MTCTGIHADQFLLKVFVGWGEGGLKCVLIGILLPSTQQNVKMLGFAITLKGLANLDRRGSPDPAVELTAGLQTLIYLSGIGLLK